MLGNIILSVQNINKNFGNVTALKDFSINIKSGEFVTILGPSGCGKTTLLRIIAGLETPDTGRIILNNVDVTNFPPERRKVNTVFQNYALFPHMDVFDNIAYGLKLKRIPKAEIRQKVYEILKLVRLEDYGDRKIDQLSGGQKQRVSIARSLILKPDVLLLDEPLGALDHKLRLAMQDELKNMQKISGTTFVYITHDQDEALNLSDRIILMNNACIEQIGTPDEIYKKPVNSFVANFIGESNILNGKRVDDSTVDFGLFLENISGNSQVQAVIRPENIIISEDGIDAEVVKQSIKGNIIVTELMLNSEYCLKMHGFDTPLLTNGQIVKIKTKSDVHYIYE